MATERATLAALPMGILVWAFVLLIPWLHVHGGAPEDLRAVALATPLAVLAAGAAARSEALLLTGFPVSFLPALVTDGALSGRRVYGVDAWAITACFLGLYLVTALRPPPGHAASRDLAIFPARTRALLALHGVAAVALLWVLVVTPAVGEQLRDTFERSHGPEAAQGRALAAGVGCLVWLWTLLRVQLPALSRMAWHRPAALDPLTREFEQHRADTLDKNRVVGDLRASLLLGTACALALVWIMLR